MAHATPRPAMTTRRLGTSGLEVSSICLGTMTFGEADANSFMHGACADEPTSFAIMDRALQAGVNFFDTANVYGQDGLSEQVVGRWMAERGTRDDVVLATKCRFRMKAGPNGTGASRHQIVRACEDSLRRLQTDRIDLYQVHMVDMDVPEEETLRALDDLVRAGKVHYIGCSNYQAWRLADSQWLSRTKGLERYVSLQSQWSLAERGLERECVTACREFGVGILPWSPLGGGFLTGKYRKGMPQPEGSRFAIDRWKARYAAIDTDRSWAILDACDEVAAAHGATVAQVALAWLLHRPEVSSVIVGARTVAQLDDNLAAVGLALTDAEVARLDEASAFDLGYPYTFIKNIDPDSRW